MGGGSLAKRALAVVLSVLLVFTGNVPIAGAAPTDRAASIEGRTYTVKFDANGGTGSMEKISLGETLAPAEYDDEGNLVAEAQAADPAAYRVTLPASSFSREGFAFAGWNTTPDGEKTQRAGSTIKPHAVADGTVIDYFTAEAKGGVSRADVLDAVDSDGVLVLYAQWEAVESEEPGDDAEGTEESEGEEGATAEDGTEGSGESDDADAAGKPQGSTSSKPETEGSNSSNDDGSDSESGASEGSGSTESEGAAGDAEAADAVDGESAPFDPTGSRLAEPRLTSLSALEYALGEAPVTAFAAGDVLQVGSSRISSFKSEWLTPDDYADDSADNLSLRRGTNDQISARFRITLSLAGLRAYAPGEIALTIPKSLFRTAAGAETGSLALAVPAAPDATAAYAYSELADSYLITNMRAISATGTSTFEFTLSGVRPADLTDMAVQGPFAANVAVSVDEGQMRATANGLTATVDTSARATGAAMTVNEVQKDISAVPTSLRGKLSGNPTDYYYVDYYTSVSVTATQASSLAFRFQEDSGIAGAQVLGSISNGAVVSSAADAEGYASLGGASYHNGAVGYVHTWVAYPTSSLPENTVHTFKGTVSYKVTSASDRQQTTAGTTRSRVWVVRNWQEPTGSGSIDKKAAASYPVGASSLRTGESVAVAFAVTADLKLMPYTWDGADAANKQESEYNKKDVTLLMSDPGPSITGQGAMDRNDGYLSRLRFEAPQMKDYQRIDEGTFDYRPVGTAGAPTFAIQAQNASGAWANVATLTWNGNTPSFAGLASGVSASGNTLTFPENAYLAWRVSATTRADGIAFSAYPTYLVKASSPKVRAALTAAGESGSVVIENRATLDRFEGASAAGTPVQTHATRTATAALGTLAWGSSAEASVAQKSVDRSGQAFRLAFTATARTDTNVYTDEDYEDAVEAGIVTRQEGGTFYDLLPAGVVPDLSTVRAVNGDAVLWAKTYENWRGSDRTMLVVRTMHVAKVQNKKEARFESVGIAFEGTYSWKDANDRGGEVRHTVAYESDAEVLGNQAGRRGEPDNPLAGHNSASKGAVGADAPLMTNISETRKDAASKTNSFVYASASAKVAADFYSVTGFSLAVEVNGDGRYADGVSSTVAVNDGGTYRYRIRMDNDDVTKSTGVVLYTSLENYNGAGAGANPWRGNLLSVDASAAKRAGAAPVVYYSERTDLDLTRADSADADLSNSAIWSTERPANVGAVAVDCRKAADGTDFVLGAGKSLEATLLMRAPDAASVGGTGSYIDGASPRYAFNSAAARSARVTPTGEVDAAAMDVYNYTRVGLRAHAVSVTKAWDDGNDADSLRRDSVTVHLLRDGQRVEGASKTLSAANGWSWNVPAASTPAADDDGHQYAYSFDEDPVGGYEALLSKTATGGVERHTLTNYHELARISVSGSKVWDDEDDAAGRRANEVFVTLQASTDDGATWSDVARKAISGDTGWAYEFKRLTKMDGGKLRMYRVVEDYVPGYARSYEDTPLAEDSHSITVTNTYDPFGDLVVRNSADGTTKASAAKAFTYTIAFADENGDPLGDEFAAVVNERDTTLATGSTFTLQPGQEMSIKHMPSELKVTVTQNELPGFATESAELSGSVLAGDGLVLDFQNHYSTRGAVYLQAKKEMTGTNIKERTFTFHVREGASVVRTAQAAGSGNIDFGAIRYDAASEGAHTYTITELNGGLPGYAYDTTTKTVHVNAVDNGDGTMTVTADADRDSLVFSNVYTAKGDLQLRAWKTFTAWGEYVRSLCTVESAAANADFFRQAVPAGWFQFALTDAEDNPVNGADGKPIVATNDGEGVINVPAVPLNETYVGQTLSFRLTEMQVLDETKVDADGAKLGITNLAAQLADGIVWDEQPVEFAVTVADNGDGTLSFDAKVAGDRVTFVNTWGESELVISKEVEGTDADTSKTFEFNLQLQPAPGTKLPEMLELEYAAIDGTTVSTQSLETADLVDNAPALKAANARTAVNKVANALVGRAEPTADVPEHASADLPGEHAAAPSSSSSNQAPADANATPVVAAAQPLGQGVPMLLSTEELSEAEKARGPMAVKLDGDRANGTCTNNDCEFTWAVRADGTLVIGATEGNDEAYIGCVGNGSPFPTGANIVRVANACAVKMTHRSDKSHNGYWSSYNALFKGHGSLADISALAEWDTAGTVTLKDLFSGCGSLTDLTPLSNWDVSQVSQLYFTFDGCSSLTSLAGLENWGATPHFSSIDRVFQGCTSLVDISALKDWDVSGVSYFNMVFENCLSLTSIDALADWKFAEGATVSCLFEKCKSLTDISAVANWEMGNVARSTGIFRECESLTDISPLANWDVTNLVDVGSMFYGCKSLADLAPIAGWRFPKATYVSSMFWGCESLADISPLANWELPIATSIYGFFAKTSIENLDGLAGWRLPSVYDASSLFQDCTKLKNVDGMANWGMLTVVPEYNHANISYMFRGCSSLENIDGLKTMDVSNVEKFYEVFKGCSSLRSLKALSEWKLGVLYEYSDPFYSTFAGCTSLETLEGLENWDLSKIGEYDSSNATFYRTFEGCTALKDLSALANWDLTRFTCLEYMFKDCTSLETLKGLENWRIAEDVTYDAQFYNTFEGCTSLKDVSAIETWYVPSGNYKSFYSTFKDCTSLEEAPAFTVCEGEKSAYISSVFSGCANLRDISKLATYTKSVNSSTFSGCNKISRIGVTDSMNKDVLTNLPDAVKARLFTQEGTTNKMTPTELAERIGTGIEGTEYWSFDGSYTVSFDGNGAAGSMSDAVWNVMDAETKVPSCAFVWPGHSFLGWSASPEGADALLIPGEMTSPLVDEPGTTVTLYAQWEKQSTSTEIGEDGGAVIRLSAGQKVSIKGLPAGCAYTIVESDEAGWHLDATKSSGTAGVTAPAGETLAQFVNVYDPSTVYATVRAQKVVAGAAGADGSLAGYAFVLTDEAGNVAGTALSDATGAVAFDALSFTAAGEHTYTLSESKDDSKISADMSSIIDFDTTEHEVTVTVSDNGAGAKTATVAYDGAEEPSAFTNAVQTASLTVTKTADSSLPAGKEFSYEVVVSDGHRASFALKAGESKVIEGLAHGSTYTVTEADPGSGYTAAGERVRTGLVFAGRPATEVFGDSYAADGTFQVQVAKQYQGEALEAGMFQFELLAADDPDTVLDAASNMRDGSVLFSPIAVDAPGTYRYFVREVNSGDDRVSYDAGETAVTVTATDNGDGSLACEVAYSGTTTFVNAVETARLTLTTSMEGHSAASEGRTFSYRLELVDRTGSPVDVGVAVSPASGGRASGLVRPGDVFEVAPGEPVVLELPLDVEYRLVQLDVPGFTTTSEGAAGTLRAGDDADAVFHNVYAAEGTASVRAKVRLEGANLATEQFAFQLVDENGNVVEEVRNDAAAGGLDAEIPAEGEAVADGSAEAMALGADTELLASQADGGAATQSAAAGEIVFADIPLTVADHGKARVYTLRQVNDAQPNIVYDEREVKVEVKATDDGEGNLAVAVAYDGADSAEFVNRVRTDADDPANSEGPGGSQGVGGNGGGSGSGGADDGEGTPLSQTSDPMGTTVASVALLALLGLVTAIAARLRARIPRGRHAR